jgi:hypothetical protein
VNWVKPRAYARAIAAPPVGDAVLAHFGRYEVIVKTDPGGLVRLPLWEGQHCLALVLQARLRAILFPVPGVWRLHRTEDLPQRS